MLFCIIGLAIVTPFEQDIFDTKLNINEGILNTKEFNIATPPQNQFYERIIHIAHFCTMFQYHNECSKSGQR